MANYSMYAGHIKQESKEWVEKLARFGFIAKGVIYVLVGIFAAMMALNMSNGSEASRNGAAQTILEQPFGQILGWLLVIGLAGYVIWRLVQAIKDPDNYGTDAKGMVRRIGFAISGFIYGAFTFSLIRNLTGSGSGGGSNSRQALTAQVLQWDGGNWLVAIVGIIVMIVGGVYLYRAYTTKFNKRMNNQQMSPDERTWITRLGRIGFTSRGIVWLILGYFLMMAGIKSNAGEVKDSQGVFATIGQLSYGQWILLIVAIGVVAYGIFQFAKARYYRVRI
jgi:hypothetical protein